MYKKIAFLLFITTVLASCGVGRSTVSSPKNASLQDELIEYGRKYLGKPYKYAGKGPDVFDCSGYTSFVFNKFGYKLSPSSSGQDRQVPNILRKEDLSKGDLVFFEGQAQNGQVGHVGIVTKVKPNGEFDFIHASINKGVTITKSTEPYYASRYLRGGRVIDNNTVAKQETIETKKNTSSKTKPSIQKQKTPTIVEVLTQEETEKEQIIIVQTDSTKTPQLVEREIGTDTDTNKEQNDSTQIPKPQPIIRQENISVPKPARKSAPTNSLATSATLHTVKPGETLYSISRQYNCSVEELRQWNPQLENTLKAGEKLTVKP